MSKCSERTSDPVLIDVNDITSHNIDFDYCENNKNVVLDSQNLSSIGRFLSVTTTVKNVCPNKQIAIGLRLYETTGESKIIKGHKMFAIQHDRDCCTDILYQIFILFYLKRLPKPKISQILAVEGYLYLRRHLITLI